MSDNTKVLLREALRRAYPECAKTIGLNFVNDYEGDYPKIEQYMRSLRWETDLHDGTVRINAILSHHGPTVDGRAPNTIYTEGFVHNLVNLARRHGFNHKKDQDFLVNKETGSRVFIYTRSLLHPRKNMVNIFHEKQHPLLRLPEE